MQPAITGGKTMRTVRLDRRTWTLIIWTIVAAFLAFLVYNHNQGVCDQSLFGREGCEAAGVAPSFWQPFIVIWLLGAGILGILWLAIRPRKRLCPVCGADVRPGVTACQSCGHDFAAAAASGAPPVPPPARVD
jgi:hypothetical protein